MARRPDLARRWLTDNRLLMVKGQAPRGTRWHRGRLALMRRSLPSIDTALTLRYRPDTTQHHGRSDGNSFLSLPSVGTAPAGTTSLVRTVYEPLSYPGPCPTALILDASRVVRHLPCLMIFSVNTQYSNGTDGECLPVSLEIFHGVEGRKCSTIRAWPPDSAASGRMRFCATSTRKPIPSVSK